MEQTVKLSTVLKAIQESKKEITKRKNDILTYRSESKTTEDLQLCEKWIDRFDNQLVGILRVQEWIFDKVKEETNGTDNSYL